MKQSPWSKREVVITVFVVTVLIGGYIVHEMRSDEFLDKTHQIEIGMSLQEAVAILGEPTKRQGSKEAYLRHDERPRWVELGKENSLTQITWSGTSYVFRAFVVSDEIIAIRLKRSH